MGAKPGQGTVWSALQSGDVLQLSWCVGGIMGSLLLYGILQVDHNAPPDPRPAVVSQQYHGTGVGSIVCSTCYVTDTGLILHACQC